MMIRRFLAALALATSIAGLASCSGGNGSAGFVPATAQAATRTPQDDMYPHQ